MCGEGVGQYKVALVVVTHCVHRLVVVVGIVVGGIGVMGDQVGIAVEEDEFTMISFTMTPKELLI